MFIYPLSHIVTLVMPCLIPAICVPMMEQPGPGFLLSLCKSEMATDKQDHCHQTVDNIGAG